MDYHVIQHPIQTCDDCMGTLRGVTGDLGCSFVFNFI